MLTETATENKIKFDGQTQTPNRIVYIDCVTEQNSCSGARSLVSDAWPGLGLLQLVFVILIVA